LGLQKLQLLTIGVDRPMTANDNMRVGPVPTSAQRRWLRRGLKQPGGKLPLFDGDGRRVSRRTVDACIEAGWAEHWFTNPIKPDWQVCKLTKAGRAMLTRQG